MKTMPYKLKEKLRQFQKASEKKRDLELEVNRMIAEYGVDPDCLYAVDDNTKVRTEGLAFMSNAEGGVEENIEEIEKVFLYYVNHDKD